MNKFLFFVCIAVLSSSGLHAQTRCATDLMGNTACRDNQAQPRVGTDQNSVDNFGDTSTRQGQENANRRGSNNNSSSHDMRRTRQGDGARPRNESSGNTIYRDNRGSTVRCGAGSYGDPACR